MIKSSRTGRRLIRSCAPASEQAPDRASSASQLSTWTSARYASRKTTAGDHAARAADGEREVGPLTAIALVRGRVRVLGTHKAVADEDAHRPVTADDIDDRPSDIRVTADRHRGDVLAPDLRDVAATEPRQAGEDRVGTQDPDTGAANIARARRAIHEIHAREAWEQQAADDERAAQLCHWYDDDHAGLVGSDDAAEFADTFSDDHRD